MISGIHGMFYSSQPEELRAFLRDVLGLPCTDVGGGWLIYDLESADMGVHPTDHPGSPPSGTHSVAFHTQDLASTVAELRRRGVVFATEIEDRGYGLVVELVMPGGVRVEIYQPLYR